MREEFPDDLRAPAFFVSYARPRPIRRSLSKPTEANRFAMRFFSDLTVIVNELVPVLPGEEPGFMDVTMEGGELWTTKILNVAGTCQIFIALLSRKYLQSEWCAMEWDVFSRRRVVKRDGGSQNNDTCILPVYWAPIVGPIPPMVDAVNRFIPSELPDDSIGSQYREHGMFGLLQRRQESAYQSIIWRLGLRIQHLWYSHWVEQLIPPDITGLHSAFAREAP